MKSTYYTGSYELDWQDALLIFENIPDLYLILSPNLKVLTASDAYLEAISVSREEVRSMSIEDMLSRYCITDLGDLEAIKANLLAIARTSEPHIIGVQQLSAFRRLSTGTTSHAYWQVSNTPVLDANKNLQYIIHKVNDITEIIKKEKEFQASLDEDLKKIAAGSDFLKKAEEAGSTGSYRMGLQDHSIWFSDGMYKLLGYEPQAFLPTLEYLNSISHPEDIAKANSAITNAAATRQPYEYVRRIFSPQGDMRCIFSKGRVTEDEFGNPLHILGVSHDITEKIRQEEELANAHAAIRQLEQMQKLEIFKATIWTQEEERNRIAEDLRNGIGQLLFAVKMNLRQFDGDNALANPQVFLQIKGRTDQILAEAIKEVRRLSHLMTPAILEDFGLEETIKDLCRQLSPKLKITYSFVGLENRLDRYLEVSIFRLAQEIMIIILGNAAASMASLELKHDGTDVFLTAFNDAPGHAEHIKSNSLGFESLLNRVRLLNGQIDVDNSINNKITIRIPVGLHA
jgi:PAS domain S-box-containing protein